MSMNISVDPSGLTQEQREAVAGFILAYPRQAAEAFTTNNVHVVTSAVADTPAPEAAFGQPPGAAFPLVQEVPPAPKAAPFAHFTVGVSPPPTAPEVAPATSTAQSVPPALAAAPVPSAPPAAPLTGNPVELDKNNLPWDHRIHGEKKTKNADGTWRKRKNLDAALLASVEAELRALMSNSPAPVANGVATIVPAGSAQDPFAMFAANIAATAPQQVLTAPATVPAAPVTSTASDVHFTAHTLVEQPAPVVDPRAAYVALIGRASAAIQAGKLTQAEATQCCSLHGVPALPLLANRLDLVQQVSADIDAIIASRP